MRIGIVTEYYRPWPGGISEHVHHEAAGLRRRGHDVLILTGPATAGWRDDDDDVIRLGFEYVFTSNGALSRMVLDRRLLRFRRLLRSYSLDVVHVHAPMDPVLGMAALIASDCATVGTFHASFTPSLLWDTLYRTLRPVSKPIWQRMHGRIAVSEEACRSISHYFPGDYDIIPNGVDTERFHPEQAGTQPARGSGDGGPNILFVGRADPRKGLPLLLRAFVEVRRKIPGVRLAIVGVERAEVAPLLAELGDEVDRDIRFVGYAPPEAMPGHYAGCDVFCSPATGQESQGIVLLEAMAAGRPPLAFAIPGYRDVVHHDRDGWLIQDIGVEPLVAGLCEVLGNSQRLARLAENGRRTALGFSWPHVVERIEASFLRAREVTDKHLARVG